MKALMMDSIPSSSSSPMRSAVFHPKISSSRVLRRYKEEEDGRRRWWWWWWWW